MSGRSIAPLTWMASAACSSRTSARHAELAAWRDRKRPTFRPSWSLKSAPGAIVTPAKKSTAGCEVIEGWVVGGFGKMRRSTFGRIRQ